MTWLGEVWWACRAAASARRAEKAARQAEASNAATKRVLLDAVAELRGKRPPGAGSEPIETVAQQARRQ